MSMSNVISLEERRRQKAQQQEPAAPKASGGNVLAAAGFVLAVPSLAFLGFVLYQAIRLQVLGDTFVVVLVAATAGYLAVGATLLRFGRRFATMLHGAREEETTDVVLDAEDDEDEHSSTILEFPTPNPVHRMISIRCASCASRYLAPVTDLSCPSCGRGAMAG
jgi:hypothetical protein